MDARNAARIAAVVACAFWGFAGYFTRELMEIGLDSVQIIQMRFLLSVLIILAGAAVTDIRVLKPSKRGVPMVMFFGAVAIIYGVSYSESMERIPLSIASILEMTSPYFVLLFSFLPFREKIGPAKIVSTVCAFVGGVMITGFVAEGHINELGIVFGLCSGLFLALCSISIKMASNRDGNLVSLFFWVLVVATIGTMLITDPVESVRVSFGSTEGIWLVLGNALLITVIPFGMQGWAYTKIPVTTISILSITQCIFCSIAGFLLYQEVLDLYDGIGATIIMMSLFVLSYSDILADRKAAENGQ